LKTPVQLYKVLAFVSFIVLFTVQFSLVYNTFKLKDEDFFVAEKGLINELYSKSIRNDKVYPGAQLIINKYIYRNMTTLEYLYNKKSGDFVIFKQKLCDSIFQELRSKSNMDSLFAAVIAQNKLNNYLQYRLLINSVSINFSGNLYIPIYQSGINYPLIKSTIQTPYGIIIDGTLDRLIKQNRVTFLNVTSPQDHSYQIAFSLYVDTPARYIAILKLMMPTFALSLFSILAVVLIYFYTLKNFLKQKKLAEMKSDFINSITHEFHTPLATILIANKNLQNEKILERKENIRPLTTIIERQSQRLSTLFNNVLNITTMNEATLEKKIYFLNELLSEIIFDYQLKLSDSNVEIEFLEEAENYEVLLDKFWFTTMLLNIFENAIKYNNRENKKIRVNVSDEKKNIQIHISDNGIGMSFKDIQHIFEKFYRNKLHNCKNVSGLGLGLFYTKECIKAHGWEMEVKSQEGVGSEFIIFIQQNN